MATVALIFKTPSTAFASYTVVSDLCEVVAVSTPADALDIDVPIQAVFVEASMLTRESVAELLEMFSPLTTRMFALISPDFPVFESHILGLKGVRVVHGPLTTALATKCLVGIAGIRIPQDQPSFLTNAANDRI